MVSPKQEFVGQCIALAIGVEYEALASAVERFESGEMTDGKLAGLDILAIIALFEMLMPMIQSLIEGCNANDDVVNKRIRKQRLGRRAAFRYLVSRTVRDGPAELRRHTWLVGTIMMDLAKDASEEEVAAVITQCRNETEGIVA